MTFINLFLFICTSLVHGPSNTLARGPYSRGHSRFIWWYWDLFPSRTVLLKWCESGGYFCARARGIINHLWFHHKSFNGAKSVWGAFSRSNLPCVCHWLFIHSWVHEAKHFMLFGRFIQSSWS